MNTNLTSSQPQRSRIHPLVAGAAVAVILASATGIAAMTGLLPVSHAVTEPAPPVTATAAPVANAPVAAPQPAPVQQTAQQAAPARPPVHHPHRATPAAAPNYANNQGYQAPYEAATPRPVAADPYAGEVVAINTVQAPEPTTGLGALGGAVAGGLVGNQIGGGRGKILTTIAGAVGGGLAGNGIEHAVRKQTTYQVQVRMQDGSYRNFSYPTQPAVQIGERVHVSGDSLSAS
ncbi:glycine zipper 2TM domain-containing protein [Paraburkholderia phytofirmans]|uniref:17 kDa surface antigen n=1 Tax=Paraburkholderia phytofirmans (strain DSM 17436 / LMG 22146 / PsJN) TaxID=398527 RepID=B2TDU1_PARPJ|nr:glycine zipper 2TM domain-containing protein [Paraburkholderia phytofirmans]ACD19131.1 17 kDa surface antigen [Paraburkholderia phytofirmans PsJN]